MEVRRVVLCAFLAAFLDTSGSCGRKDDPAQTAEPQARAPAFAPQTRASPASRGAAAAPSPTVSGGEESSASIVTECPKSLGGAESVNRVITRDCGVVVVAQDYHLNNGSLTLEAGATLAFSEGTSLNIGYNDSAKLVVRGTEQAPVTFTAAGDKTAGAWRGLRLFEHADRSTIDHLVLEDAGQDGQEAIHIDAQDVGFVGSTIRNVQGVGVGFGRHGTVAHFAGNSFERIGRWPVSLGPAAVDGIDGMNRLPAGSVVHVYGGTIEDKVTWRSVGAPYYVTEDVSVESATGDKALLAIEEGVEVRFAPDAHILVGYSQPGALQTHGAEGAPVTLTASGESWPWLRIYQFGEGSFAGTLFEKGGSPESAGVLRVDGALALTGCTFRGNIGGVMMTSRAKIKTLDDNAFVGNERWALLIYPQQLGGLGSTNRYGDADRIAMFGGTVEENMTWRAQRTLIEVLGDLRVDGRTELSVESGSRFAMKDKTRIVVGDRDNASLRLMGTAERPIDIFGLRDDPGSWGGIRLLDASRDSVIEHVRLRGAGGDGGVFVEGEANATISDLACAKCGAPVLAYACGAKVAATGVTAAEGTERGEVRLGCP